MEYCALVVKVSGLQRQIVRAQHTAWTRHYRAQKYCFHRSFLNISSLILNNKKITKRFVV